MFFCYRVVRLLSGFCGLTLGVEVGESWFHWFAMIQSREGCWLLSVVLLSAGLCQETRD